MRWMRSNSTGSRASSVTSASDGARRASSSAQPGYDIEHLESGVKTGLPNDLTTPDNRWNFVNTLKLIIASKVFEPAPLSVESLIRAVISNTATLDPISQVGALAAICPEIKPDGVRPAESLALASQLAS